MAKSPAFQFYASDFLTDTQSFDITEVGIYIRLLSNQWVNGFLPKQPERLSRIAGCSVEELKKAWVILGFKFLENADGSIYNKKLEEVRDVQNSFKEKQASNGRKGGRPPKNKNPNETQIKPKNNPTHNPNKSSSSSSIIKESNKEKIPLNVDDVIKYMTSMNEVDENTCNSEGHSFFDYYTSNGWKVGGKSAMQDWKSSARGWLRRNIKNKEQTSFNFKKNIAEANVEDF